MIKWILAYRFLDGLRYWSNTYVWTTNLDEATLFGTYEEAESYAYHSGSFVLAVCDGEIIE